MNRTVAQYRIAAAATLACLALPLIAADYLAENHVPGRTGWLKDEKVISKANAGQIKLLWKTKLPSTVRQMHNLFSPLVVGSFARPRE